MPDPVTVRFAPSPTGHLHIGNARTALFNALYAMKARGRFILRLDDTDRDRSTEAFAAQIVADIEWLGIAPDRVARQSDRLAAYDAAVERLKAAGRLYPCYETPDELERKRKRQRARGRPPVYDRAALNLSDDEKAAFEAEGRAPHWRFLLDNHAGDPFAPESRIVTWTDLCRGEQSVDLATVSDPVLIRADGSYLYTLPSVVDDIDMTVTHVIRGEDHVTNTGVQIDLIAALGGTPQVFGHHNLLTLASGEGLSKRRGDLSLLSLKDAGYEAMAIASLATLIGTSEAVRPYPDLPSLAADFDLSMVSRAPAKFDPDDVKRINARLLHDMPYKTAAARLQSAGIDGGEPFWLAVRGNLDVFADVARWWQVVDGPIAPVIDREASAVLAAGAELLPEEPFGPETWGAWTAAIRERTGAKGRALFMPLRLALTGERHGPELAALLPLIGRTKAAARLAGQAA